ncbi:MAG: PorV/PorQ family protein [candidate division FCPU426 bacterium]
MRMRRLMVAGLWMLGMPLAAGANEAVLSTAGKVLQIGIGPRAVAMGEAQAAAAEDIYALYWNPAGLAQISNPQLSYMHNLWLQDIQDAYLTYAQRLFKGGMAFSVNYINFGTFDKIGVDTDGYPVPLNQTFTPYTLVVGAGYGTQLYGDLDVGGSVRLVSESVDTFNSMTLALDLGARYRDLLPNLNAGLVIQNLGLPLEGFQLPLTIKAGLGYNLPLLVDDKRDHFLIVADANVPIPVDQPVYANFGLEYDYQGAVAIRAGYRVSEINQLGGMTGLSAGLGVNISNFKLDYAVAPFGDLGLTHRIALTYEFATAKAAKKVKRIRRVKAARPVTGGTGVLLPEQMGTEGNVLLPKVSDMAMRTDIRVEVDAKPDAKVKTQIESATFKLIVSEGKKVKRWSLKIADAKDRTVKSFTGKGLPSPITWDGKDQNQQPVKESIFCRYAFKVETTDGGAEKLSGAVVAKSRGDEEAPSQETLQPVYFDEGAADLSDAAVKQLSEAAIKIKSRPYVKVMIEGYTDGGSESPSSFLLSQRRAESVSRYLTASYKIPLKDFSVHARGNKNPAASNQTESGRQQNRRVEITIIYRR